ncbi:hypothetical protein KSP39_PZI024327 [Platanthera zijinensis]|uniref:Uncharacterized protein n=1 Tax=Platanthera zijinensis TaxID=2320716 RepID=A0AAP0FTQ8_9ASPA
MSSFTAGVAAVADRRSRRRKKPAPAAAVDLPSPSPEMEPMSLPCTRSELRSNFRRLRRPPLACWIYLRLPSLDPPLSPEKPEKNPRSALLADLAAGSPRSPMPSSG